MVEMIIMSGKPVIIKKILGKAIKFLENIETSRSI